MQLPQHIVAPEFTILTERDLVLLYDISREQQADWRERTLLHGRLVGSQWCYTLQAVQDAVATAADPEYDLYGSELLRGMVAAGCDREAAVDYVHNRITKFLPRSQQ